MNTLDYVQHDELRSILNQLEQALYNHQQWHNSLIRTLVCRLPSDKHDVMPYAYKECRFGQWIYSDELKKMTEHPGFIAIKKAHQSMHDRASQLLINNSNNISISPQEYDFFSNSLEQLRLEIFSLRNELEGLLYTRDPLTGTINRINMPQILREQLELAKRQEKNCCLALIDFDFFKKVNDTYGHQAGDIVLSTIGHYIIKNIRSYDKIFRYGGEELLMCLPFTDLTLGKEIMEQFRKGIAELKILIQPEKTISITVSIGLTLLDVNSPVEASIEHADKAMYVAKSNGRNCIHAWP